MKKKDSKSRCSWANSSREMQVYHDNEWNKLILDDFRFFEFFCLEIFQAGLNWDIIIKKRPFFKIAFDNFDFEKIKSYDNKKVKELLEDKNIVRNKLKVKSCIFNAEKFSEIKREYDNCKSSFYCWLKKEIESLGYDDFNSVPLNVYVKLFKKNFKFVGNEIVREFLESSGIIKKEHDKDCFMYKK